MTILGSIESMIFNSESANVQLQLESFQECKADFKRERVPSRVNPTPRTTDENKRGKMKMTAESKW